MKKIYTVASDIPELADLDLTTRQEILSRAITRFWFSRYNARPVLISLLVFAVLTALSVSLLPYVGHRYRIMMIALPAMLGSACVHLLFLNSVRPELGKLVAELADEPPARYEREGSIRKSGVILGVSVLPWILIAALVAWLAAYTK